MTNATEHTQHQERCEQWASVPVGRCRFTKQRMYHWGAGGGVVPVGERKGNRLYLFNCNYYLLLQHVHKEACTQTFTDTFLLD